jgi:hypothetical protein
VSRAQFALYLLRVYLLLIAVSVPFAAAGWAMAHVV